MDYWVDEKDLKKIDNFKFNLDVFNKDSYAIWENGNGILADSYKDNILKYIEGYQDLGEKYKNYKDQITIIYNTVNIKELNFISEYSMPIKKEMLYNMGFETRPTIRFVVYGSCKSAI